MRKNLMLEIEDLVVTYETDDGIVHAVNGLNIELGKKQILGLVGETGAGKTTTGLSIMRLVPDPPGIINRGKITLDGRDLFKLKENEMEEIRGHVVSMIFQDPMTSLNPVMTVGEQITEVISIHEELSKSETIEKAKKMIELVGISRNRFNDYPHEFSGGMKQRVVIAIALACSPDLLIADEPTTALDVTIQAQILDLMKQLKDEFDMSMIMVTHDLGVVAEVCDYVSIMYAGRIIEHGTVEDVFNSPKHPYTEGLFNSIPNINERTKMLKPVPGLMPDPMDLPSGCTFSPRCKYKTEECENKIPEMKKISETHNVSCIRYEDPNFKLKGRSNF